MSKPLWYVFHVGAGKETDVKQQLDLRIEQHGMRDRIPEVLVPPVEKALPKTGVPPTKRVYPGYVLVRMVLDDDTWYLVKHTPGVTGFVGMGRRPTPLDEKEIELIKYQMGLRDTLPATATVRFVEKEKDDDDRGDERGPIH
jgi:transcriptional antiterminator NusG